MRNFIRSRAVTQSSTHTMLTPTIQQHAGHATAQRNEHSILQTSILLSMKTTIRLTPAHPSLETIREITKWFRPLVALRITDGTSGIPNTHQTALCQLILLDCMTSLYQIGRRTVQMNLSEEPSMFLWKDFPLPANRQLFQEVRLIFKLRNSLHTTR